MNHELLALLIASSVGTATTSVRAQTASEVRSESEDEEPDWALWSGVAVAGLGGATVVTSGVVLGAGDDEECGLSGCHPLHHGARHQVGIALMGAGAGLLGAGLFVTVGSLAAPPSEGEARADNPRMVAGIALTSMGIASGGVANAALVGVRGDDSYYTAIAGFAVSGVLLGVGIPLFATGARTRGRDERSAAVAITTTGQGLALTGLLP